MEASEHESSEELKRHYAAMLGLDRPWRVGRVELQVLAKRLEIQLEEECDANFDCPERERRCWLHDHAPLRRWRHLDAMGFETLIVASLPRVRCPEHGVKTVNAPWAGAHSRFTRTFEAFAIKVLQATQSLQAASGLLGLNWKSLQDIVTRSTSFRTSKTPPRAPWKLMRKTTIRRMSIASPIWPFPRDSRSTSNK